MWEILFPSVYFGSYWCGGLGWKVDSMVCNDCERGFPHSRAVSDSRKRVRSRRLVFGEASWWCWSMDYVMSSEEGGRCEGEGRFCCVRPSEGWHG